LIRSYDVQVVTANEGYWMDWFATGRPSGKEWQWSQTWDIAGESGQPTGGSSMQPIINLHTYPFTALVTDTPWQTSSAMIAQSQSPPPYAYDSLNLIPTASIDLVNSDNTSTYKYVTSGWQCNWYRYRLRLSQALPYNYNETYLAITHQYTPNPGYGLGGFDTNNGWVYSGVGNVTTMTLTIPSGQFTGAWQFQAPTVDGPGKYVLVQLVPLEVLQRPLAPDGISIAKYNFNPSPAVHTPAPRFSRWRNAFTDPGGQFNQDWVKDDPDCVIIRIDADVIDPTVPLMNVKIKNIAGVSGRTTDVGFLSLTLNNGGWETEPFLFVTDNIDDTQYNGDQGVDDNQDDQTRLASFGAEIDIKAQFLNLSTPVDVPISKMYQPVHNVNVEVNVFKDVAAVTEQNKIDAQAAFDAARLLYRQIGVDLVQQGGVNVVNLAAGYANFIAQNGGYIDYSTRVDWADDHPSGQNFADYLVGLSAGTTSIKLYYTTADLKDLGGVMGEGGDPLGWAKLRGDYAIVELKPSGVLSGYVTAHEIGHVLGAQHPVGSYPYRIMNDTMGAPTDNYTDPRRFSEADEQSFVGGKFFK
jgi:hypothetical protein